MRTIRLTKVLDESGEVRIPMPADFHAGDTVHVELSLQGKHGEVPQRSWSEWLDIVEGIFEEKPLELPNDSQPEKIDFDE